MWFVYIFSKTVFETYSKTSLRLFRYFFHGKAIVKYPRIWFNVDRNVNVIDVASLSTSCEVPFDVAALGHFIYLPQSFVLNWTRNLFLKVKVFPKRSNPSPFNEESVIVPVKVLWQNKVSSAHFVKSVCARIVSKLLCHRSVFFFFYLVRKKLVSKNIDNMTVPLEMSVRNYFYKYTRACFFSRRVFILSQFYLYSVTVTLLRISAYVCLHWPIYVKIWIPILTSIKIPIDLNKILK